MGMNLEEVSFACHRMEMYADTGSNGTRQLVSLEDLGTEIPGAETEM